MKSTFERIVMKTANNHRMSVACVAVALCLAVHGAKGQPSKTPQPPPSKPQRNPAKLLIRRKVQVLAAAPRARIKPRGQVVARFQNPPVTAIPIKEVRAAPARL